jgi:hypothetical protein
MLRSPLSLGLPYTKCIKPESEFLDVRIIENPHFLMGMSSSVKTGFRASEVNRDVEASVLIVRDLPFFSTRLIDRLVKMYQESRAIVASQYADILCIPALARSHFTSQCWVSLQTMLVSDKLLNNIAMKRSLFRFLKVRSTALLNQSMNGCTQSLVCPLNPPCLGGL